MPKINGVGGEDEDERPMKRIKVEEAESPQSIATFIKEESVSISLSSTDDESIRPMDDNASEVSSAPTINRAASRCPPLGMLSQALVDMAKANWRIDQASIERRAREREDEPLVKIEEATSPQSVKIEEAESPRSIAAFLKEESVPPSLGSSDDESVDNADDNASEVSSAATIGPPPSILWATVASEDEERADQTSSSALDCAPLGMTSQALIDVAKANWRIDQASIERRAKEREDELPVKIEEAASPQSITSFIKEDSVSTSLGSADGEPVDTADDSAGELSSTPTINPAPSVLGATVTAEEYERTGQMYGHASGHAWLGIAQATLDMAGPPMFDMLAASWRIQMAAIERRAKERASSSVPSDTDEDAASATGHGEGSSAFGDDEASISGGDEAPSSDIDEDEQAATIALTGNSEMEGSLHLAAYAVCAIHGKDTSTC
jgi:hypothetical protein